jgi:hypothetical protein
MQCSCALEQDRDAEASREDFYEQGEDYGDAEADGYDGPGA